MVFKFLVFSPTTFVIEISSIFNYADFCIYQLQILQDKANRPSLHYVAQLAKLGKGEVHAKNSYH